MARSKLAVWIAITTVAATALLGMYPSALAPARAGQPSGRISVDASPGDNLASAVGTIGGTANVADSNCGDNTPEIFVDLVIGDSGSDLFNPSGGIPSGNDIGGWQARIQFDPAVLNFIGHLVTDGGASGVGYYMEKASDHTQFGNNHIIVSNVVGPGVVDIGSTIAGTPAGAFGVGLLATVAFDCLGDGVTSIDIGDGNNSFFADIDLNNHEYARRNGAVFGVNVGEEALAGHTPTSATPTTATGPPSSASEGHADEGPADGLGSANEPSPPTSAPSEPEASPAGGGDGDGWIIAVIAAVSIGGLALIAGAAVYWRRFRGRA